MKKLGFKSLVIAGLCVSFFACKKHDDQPSPVISVDNKDGKALTSFMRDNGPQFESFSIDASRGGTVITKKGIKYKIPANGFINKDGSPVTGLINVSIKEITSASSMILGDKPTVTSDGKILISFGEFYIKASQGTANVNLKADSAVAVKIPFKPANGGFQEVPMWDGDSAVTITNSGYDYQNNAVTITTTGYVNKGLSWAQQTSNYALFNPSTGTLDFKLNTLLHWVNCDALYSLPGTKTTVMTYFTNHFNPLTGTNYSGEEPSMLYFKPKNQNSMIKFYNVILTPPTGFQGLHSYQTSIPVGLEGTFLAISSVSGTFYAEQKTVTIADPGTASYTSVSFNLSAVSEIQLLALINDMNNK